MKTPREFLQSYLRDKGEVYASANKHLAPIYDNHFGGQLSKHANAFLLSDISVVDMEDAKHADGSTTVITRKTYRGFDIRDRYQLAASGDDWKIVRIDRECFHCRLAGETTRKDCHKCHGEGWYDPRSESNSAAKAKSETLDQDSVMRLLGAPRSSPFRIQRFIVWSILALLAASAWVIRGAFVSPFPTFRSEEAIVQVGVGLTVCVLWVLLAAVIYGAVIARRIRRWWLLAIILAIIGFFSVMPWPFRYIAEVEIRLFDR